LTFCPMPGYKKNGFYFNEKSYNENIFQLEDIFGPDTVMDLKNTSNFLLKETQTLYLGLCFTLCSYGEFAKKNGHTVHLKTDFDVKIFVHQQVSEYWIKGLTEVPYDIPFTVLDVNNSDDIVAAVMSLSEIISTSLTKAESPCKTYSDNIRTENDFFINCSQKMMQERFPGDVLCTINSLNYFVPNDSSLEECQNSTSADDTLKNLKGKKTKQNKSFLTFEITTFKLRN
jgi:hypothetical protein